MKVANLLPNDLMGLLSTVILFSAYTDMYLSAGPLYLSELRVMCTNTYNIILMPLFFNLDNIIHSSLLMNI